MRAFFIGRRGGIWINFQEFDFFFKEETQGVTVKKKPTPSRLTKVGWLAIALCLGGCGAAVRRPGVPIDQPLTPVAIYLQPCLQVPPKQDDAVAGELLCRSLPFALQAELAGSKLDYRLIPASGGDGESV